MIELNRRGLITGLISFVAAPAIVRAESLMPIRSYETIVRTGVPTVTWRLLFQGQPFVTVNSLTAFNEELIRQIGRQTC